MRRGRWIDSNVLMKGRQSELPVFSPVEIGAGEVAGKEEGQLFAREAEGFVMQIAEGFKLGTGSALNGTKLSIFSIW